MNPTEVDWLKTLFSQFEYLDITAVSKSLSKEFVNISCM